MRLRTQQRHPRCALYGLPHAVRDRLDTVPARVGHVRWGEQHHPFAQILDGSADDWPQVSPQTAVCGGECAGLRPFEDSACLVVLVERELGEVP